MEDIYRLGNQAEGGEGTGKGRRHLEFSPNSSISLHLPCAAGKQCSYLHSE